MKADLDPDLTRRNLLLLAALGVVPEELLAQDAAKIQPDSYKVTLDHPKLRVLDYRARPGMGVCGSGIHSHPPHLTIAVTQQKVRDRNVNGQTILAELKPGDVFWSDAVTHETENLLGSESRALIIELKKA